MRHSIRFRYRSLICLLAGLLTAGLTAADGQAADVRAADVRAVDRPHRVVAAGQAGSGVVLERMLLLLKPSEAQSSQLDKLLTAQITPGDAQYHHWVTPDEFVQRFAPGVADAEAVAGWLRGQGFRVAALPAGRGWIEFSGTAAQVQRAFGAPVMPMEDAGGEVRYKLGRAIQLPQAIESKVAGLVSLDGSEVNAAATRPVAVKAGAEALAAESSIAKAEAMTPRLMRDSLKLDEKSEAGAGETIVIPARSNVRAEDFASFRKSFGLPDAALEVRAAGDDPGLTGDAAAATAAAAWAGVAAPGARIVLMPAVSTKATDGVDLALAAAIEARGDDGGPLARTISVGYSACESGMSAAHQQFYAALYRRAAAEGVAVIAATGDSGAAACHRPESQLPVSSGKEVNALASTLWNSAVGAVALKAHGSGLESWQTAANRAYATGGGASAVYKTPAWQTAVGIPENVNGVGRFLPDVSLPAAAAARGLAFCFGEADTTADANGCRMVTSGGSGTAAAIFAGIAATIEAKYGAQGNLAPNLYVIGHRENSVAKSDTQRAIVDVVDGTAKLGCVGGSADCVGSQDGRGEIGFAAGAGFDLASGLGSVNATALVAEWQSEVGTGPTTLVMTTQNGVTYNPSASIVLSAKVVSGFGGNPPTGTIQFYDETVGGNAGSPATVDSQGNASYTESGQFSVGGHNIVAIYSGDATYASQTSLPITINIQPSATTLTVSPSSLTPVGGSTITVTGRVTATNPGAQAPTGALTINLDGLPQGTTTLSTSGAVTSGSVMVTVPTAGSHTVQGFYAGDVNYNNSTSNSVTIIVSKTATTTSLSATPATLTAGVPETFSAVIAPVAAVAGASYNITGTVSFYDGGTTLLGIAPVTGNTAILAAIALTPTVVHTITAVYSGDTTFGPSTSAPLVLEPVLLPVTVTLAASNAVLAPGQSTTLTATVQPVNTPAVTAEQHPTGTIYFYAGQVLLGSASLVAGVGDTSNATLVVPVLPAGVYVLTAVYSGDLTYGPGTSNSLNLNVQDFSITCGLTNVTVVQGQAVTVPCVVSSLGGLTGPIALACAEQNPPQVGAMTCFFNPTSIEGNGNSYMTVTTIAGNTTTTANSNGAHVNMRGRHGPAWPGGVALGALLLMPFGIAARRRAIWKTGWLTGKTLLLMALMLGGMLGATTGCTNGITGTLERGTPLGVHTIKITAAADLNPPTVTVSHYAYVTVNVVPQ